MNNNSNNDDPEKTGNTMLLDESATPAPHALTRLQEAPVFSVDDDKGPYALLEDLEDMKLESLASEKPTAIEELEPDA